MTQVIVSGARAWRNPLIIWRELNKLAEEIEITEIIAGEARGVDTLAKRYALAHDIKYTPFPADWYTLAPGEKGRMKPDGRLISPSAGLRRNEKMLDYVAPGSYLLAFPYGPSHGTRHCIASARIRPLKEIRVIELG